MLRTLKEGELFIEIDSVPLKMGGGLDFTRKRHEIKVGWYGSMGCSRRTTV